jgi:hypothetical protein
LLFQTFYKGLTHQTRSSIDSAAGGGIMHKTLDEAFELIENMASHNFSWSIERSVAPQNPGKHQLSASDSLAAQVEVLNKQMARLLSQGKSSSIAAVQDTQGCQISGQTGHQIEECSVFTVDQTTAEVNYSQNQGPYSAGYNPQWRNHPNLSYKNNQPQQQFQGNSSNQNYKSILIANNSTSNMLAKGVALKAWKR